MRHEGSCCLIKHAFAANPYQTIPIMGTCELLQQSLTTFQCVDNTKNNSFGNPHPLSMSINRSCTKHMLPYALTSQSQPENPPLLLPTPAIRIHQTALPGFVCRIAPLLLLLLCQFFPSSLLHVLTLLVWRLFGAVL